MLIVLGMIVFLVAGCFVMLRGYDNLRETGQAPVNPSSNTSTSNDHTDKTDKIDIKDEDQPFDYADVSDTYYVGFMYDTADFLEMAPSFECVYRNNGTVEARFWFDKSDGGTKVDTRIYELPDDSWEEVVKTVNLKKLYELDPECPNPEDVCDGGYSYIYIYDKNDELLKACGGFCPESKLYNKMLSALYSNLPEELVNDAEKYKRQWKFFSQMPYRPGIFIGYDGPISELSEYNYIVLDAQNYNEKELEDPVTNYSYVLSYINVGSLEDFRDYYDEYKDLALGEYEGWEGEVWVNVSDERWQKFILEELAPSLMDKGIDGFFVDNLDVYYEYPTEEILSGLTVIMEGLKDMGIPVFINGGDAFLDAYTDAGGDVFEVTDGINQECVFTKVNPDGSFDRADEEDTEYFKKYLEKYSSRGVCIWVTEYTDDPVIIREIEFYCYSGNGCGFYITDSTDLDG